MRLRVRSLALLSGLTMGSDRALLWLWRRLVATAPIRPLAWEPPCAAGAAQEIAKRQKTKKKKKGISMMIWLCVAYCSDTGSLLNHQGHERTQEYKHLGARLWGVLRSQSRQFSDFLLFP